MTTGASPHRVDSRRTYRSAGFLLVATISMGCRGHDEAGGSEARIPAGVVLIVVDALRADHVGVYGSTQGLTPNLDGMASRGVVFANAVAPSSWTRSSVAALFTSRYPSAIGVLGRDDALESDVVTLPEVLRDTGGFETLGVTTNGNAGAAFGFGQGFDRFEVPELPADQPADDVHTAEGVTRKALHLIDERSGGRPFFLFLHYIDPHDPYRPHPGLLPWPEPAGRFDGSRHGLTPMDATSPAELTKADYDRIEHLYAGEVKYCDRWIGELLRGLEARGLRDDVVLVVTADHGEGLWDHGRRAHGWDLYQEMIHVPLIMELTARSRQQLPRSVEEPVSLVDVAPTILAAVGVAPPAAFSGADLLSPEPGERARREREQVYSQLDLDGRTLEVVRQGQWKLIREVPAAGCSPGLELYDLAEDPAERHDIAHQSPSRVAGLEASLDRARRAGLAAAMAGEQVSLDRLSQDAVDALRALGYLQSGGSGPREPTVGGELASIVDFAQADHAAHQLLHGFHAVSKGRWMARRASAVLGRNGGESKWRLDGWIDLALHGHDSLGITACVEGGETRRLSIDKSGFFSLTGDLPPTAAQAVRLGFECDHEVLDHARGGRDQRSLCVVVTSLRLL